MHTLRLISVKFEEKIKNSPIYSLDKASIGSFNILIGDNGQGKTRFINTMKFIHEMVSGGKKVISSHFQSSFEFEQDGATKISYSLEVEPLNQAIVYSEVVIKNGKTILNSKDKELYDEISNENIEHFYFPSDLPAIYSINSEQFPTINLLRSYFQRMVFIGSQKNREIALESNASKVNEFGSNIAAVMENWKEKMPDNFKEVIGQFRKFFPQIINIGFGRPPIAPLQHLPNMLTLSEKDSKIDVFQYEWADGFLRTLCLLSLPNTRFGDTKPNIRPSMILVDEIENGLDYKTLENIVEYFKDYSDEIQFIVSTHSPLVCDFVNPSSWRIVKRSGAKVKMIAPTEVEEVDRLIQDLRLKHWDFYAKHISRSPIYSVK